MKYSWLWTDAHRRVCMAKQRGENGRNAWVSLAAPSYMRKMVAEGFMLPIAHKMKPRVIDWYAFTDKGWQEYQRRYANKPDFFSPEFDEVW